MVLAREQESDFDLTAEELTAAGIRELPTRADRRILGTSRAEKATPESQRV
jgi:hypothetical protein